MYERIAAVWAPGDVLSRGAHGQLHCYAGRLVLSTLKRTVSTPPKAWPCGQAGVAASAAAFRSAAVRSNITPKSGNDFAISGSNMP